MKPKIRKGAPAFLDGWIIAYFCCGTRRIPYQFCSTWEFAMRAALYHVKTDHAKESKSGN